MVRAINLTVALAALTVAQARAQIDLSPIASFYEIEGIRSPNVTFHDGAKKVAYSPPGEWTLSGGETKLTLTPRDSAQAGATIETESAREPLPPATEANIKVYSELARRLVPEGATKVEIVEAIVSPLRISGKSMVDVTLAYSFFGQQFRMNVLIMPREKEQLRFRFASRAVDYPPLFKAFRSSLFSMKGL